MDELFRWLVADKGGARKKKPVARKPAKRKPAKRTIKRKVKRR